MLREVPLYLPCVENCREPITWPVLGGDDSDIYHRVGHYTYGTLTIAGTDYFVCMHHCRGDYTRTEVRQLVDALEEILFKPYWHHYGGDSITGRCFVNLDEYLHPDPRLSRESAVRLLYPRYDCDQDFEALKALYAALPPIVEYYGWGRTYRWVFLRDLARVTHHLGRKTYWRRDQAGEPQVGIAPIQNRRMTQAEWQRVREQYDGESRRYEWDAGSEPPWIALRHYDARLEQRARECAQTQKELKQWQVGKERLLAVRAYLRKLSAPRKGRRARSNSPRAGSPRRATSPA